MKRLFPIILLFISNILVGQTENYKVVMDKFQADYNAEKYDDIFNSFSSEMQNTLPLEDTKQFLKGLKSQVGKIGNREFVNYEQKTYAKFKTKFERAVLAVNISLNEQNQINGLFIKPYEEPSEILNKTVNALNDYPKEIAETIFSKAKNFPNKTQLSIAITQNGNTRYYGIIKINDTIKPIKNQNKIFEIGSITKVFTSTVLASLVEDKKIKLTDEINNYYSFDFNDNIKIRFENLANHTSGLPRLPQNLDLSNETNPYKNYGEDKIGEYLRSILKLENESSIKYAYSNLGAGLLGYTLGLSQKTSLQALLKSRIFEKYKMNNSFTSSQNLDNKLVKGLNANGEVVPNWDFDVLFGGGGILSTTEDLAKFADAQFNPNNRDLLLARQPTFEINENMRIGLGWHLMKQERGKDLIWHNGGTGGYTSSMALNIDEKTAVIILSNVSTFNPNMGNIDKICFELIKTSGK